MSKILVIEMMYRFRKISSLTFIFIMLMSMACENEKKIFAGPYFVRFTDTVLTEKESHSAVIKVQVHTGGPAPKEDVTINYSIGGTAREGTDYNIVGTRGKVKIKSGEYFGTIDIQLINNSNNILRSQDVILNLMTIENDSDLQVGQGPSQIGKQFTLTIQDDCILGGDYYGIADDTAVPTDDITITSLDCEEYTLSNWNIAPIVLTTRDLTFIDNGDNTLTIPPQQEETFDPDSALIDGFGTVNPVTRELSFTVREAARKNQPTHTFKLIPD